MHVFESGSATSDGSTFTAGSSLPCGSSSTNKHIIYVSDDLTSVFQCNPPAAASTSTAGSSCTL